MKSFILSWRVVLVRHDSVQPGWSMCAAIEVLVYAPKVNADTDGNIQVGNIELDEIR